MNNSYYDRKIKDLENKIKCKTRFYNTFSDFPEVGVECALFVDESTGDIYIWNGTEYVLNGAGEGAQGIQGTVGIQGTAGISPFNYGAFYDTTDQSVTAGQVTAMSYNTVDFANGVSIESDINNKPTLVEIDNAGIYNIQFSAQFTRDSGGSSAYLDIWLRKNGTNTPNTSTKIHFANNSTYIVAAWNFLVDVDPGDQFQIMWTQDATIKMEYEAENLVVPYPAIPSVILTVTQVA
jgi:hypothetical protein